MSDGGELPEFASTYEEILQAVRENSVLRGLFFLKNLAALKVDDIVQQVTDRASNYDMEAWRDRASEVGIEHQALDILDAHNPPVPYPLYFCLPEDLEQEPRLIVYYRNVAMISNKVMSNVGLDTAQHEVGIPLDATKAGNIAQHFNQIVSLLVMEADMHSPQRHLEMVYVNIGASFDGAWRNEVGRLAYASLISPLVIRLHQLKKVESIEFKLKGRIVLNGEDEDGNNNLGKYQEVELFNRSEEEVSHLLANLENQRIVYRQINLVNGNCILLNRQIIWHSTSTESQFRIGPDLITQSSETMYPWAAELKGGADPAGSDEHWKTASRAFDRIIEAARNTDRPIPQLSFIATILVDRVAREAALWLQQGKLTSVHNLTKIANDPDLREQFLSQMVEFFEAT